MAVTRVTKAWRIVALIGMLEYIEQSIPYEHPDSDKGQELIKASHEIRVRLLRHALGRDPLEDEIESIECSDCEEDVLAFCAAIKDGRQDLDKVIDDLIRSWV